MRATWQHRGALAAVALALSYLELFLPLPIPGVKLGLANIPILIALAEGEISTAFAVAILKIVASAFLFGTPLTALYSAAGTVISCTAMLIASRFKTMRLPMVSVIGALAHEAGQLMVAQALLGTPLVWYSAPLLIIGGVPTGLLVGIVATHVLERIHTTGKQEATPLPHSQTQLQPVQSMRARLYFLVYLAFVILTLKTTSWRFAVLELLFALALCFYAKLSLQKIWSSLKPFIPLAIISVLALYFQDDASFINAALTMLARLVSICVVSTCYMQLSSPQELAGLATWLLTPLSKLGIKTDGLQIAIETSLSMLPRLQEQIDAHVPAITTRDFWQKELPRLIADLYCL